MPSIRAIAVLALAAAGSGCLDIQQSLTLNRDLSGTAGFSMKIDFEPMVLFMARLEREMSGKSGEPSAEELAKARAEFAASKKSSSSGDFDAEKRELAGRLPNGVTLIDASATEGDLSLAMSLAFGFDHPAKLAEIRLPKRPKDKKAGGGAPGNPVESPFGGLKVTDEGPTVLIVGPPQNPIPASKDQAPPDPEAQKMIAEMLKGLRVGFSITSPLEVVQHNAHRKTGHTLVWEYDVKALEKLKPAQLNSAIKVRYRK